MSGFEDVILPRLWPSHLNDVVMMLLAIWRYVILLLALLVLLMQPEGSTFLVVLLASVAIFMIVDSMWLFNTTYPNDIYLRGWYEHNWSLGTLLIRVLSFGLPLFVAGATRNQKSRGWAVILALLAAAYFFMTWFVYQRQ